MKHAHLISPNGLFMAHLTPDSKLRTCSTANASNSHEFTMSSHLTAPVTLLSWKPMSQGTLSDQILLGTKDGKLFIYDQSLGQFSAEFPHIHAGQVNDAVWDLPSNTIFTCASDRNIIQWDSFTMNTLVQWKADKGSITSICAVGKDKLLSASRSIKLWDWAAQTLLKKFSGHTSYVSKMSFVNNTDYFLSFSDQDSHVSAWKLEGGNKKAPVASFMAGDQVKDFSTSISKNSEKLMVAVLTKEGALQRFFKKIRSLKGQQFEPDNTITVEIKDHTSISVSPILSFHCDSPAKFLVASGNYFLPVKIQLDSPANIKITRAKEKKRKLIQENAYDKQFKRQRLCDLPELMAPAIKNRALKDPIFKDEGVKSSYSQAAKTISLGVQSGDFDSFKAYLKIADEDKIVNIVKELLEAAREPFLKALLRAKSTPEVRLWLLVLFRTHFCFFISNIDNETKRLLLVNLDSQRMFANKYLLEEECEEILKAAEKAEASQRPEFDIDSGVVIYDESKDVFTTAVLDADDVFKGLQQ